MSADRCYCGSQQRFSACCEPLHRGTRTAATALELMRSRYSAFCSHNAAYLVATHHPSSPQLPSLAELQDSFTAQRWVCLEIRGCRQGGAGDLRGEVEFLAWYQDGADQALAHLHERSTFCFEKGRWWYLQGARPPPLARRQPAVGRNAPCWCGSGRKFKHCHA